MIEILLTITVVGLFGGFIYALKKTIEDCEDYEKGGKGDK